MNSVDFCFWLQGYFEPLTAKQVEVLKNHLSLVFRHEIDPMRLQETSATEAELNEAHTPYERPPYKSPSASAFPSGNDPLMRC